jgi:type I restriction enzyme R subunit
MDSPRAIGLFRHGLLRGIHAALEQQSQGASGKELTTDETIFTTRGIADLTAIEARVDLLADAKIRADFIQKLRAFLHSLGIVLPLPEGRRFLRDAKILGFIAKVAANLYRDQQLNLLGVEPKIRQLIDDYITAQGIDPKLPPIDILDADFEPEVDRQATAKSRASEMLHALRYHLSIHLDEDPEYYQELSDKLDAILQNLRDQWTELEKVLREFIRNQVRQGRDQAVAGLDPKIQAPFFAILKTAAETDAGAIVQPDTEAFRAIVELTITLVAQIQAEIGKVDFWRDPASRQALETTLFKELRWCKTREGQRVFQNNVRELAIRLVDLAYHRRRFLVT